MRWISLVKGRRIRNVRWIRIGHEILRIDLVRSLNERYNFRMSLKIFNYLVKQIIIHGAYMKSYEIFNDG